MNDETTSTDGSESESGKVIGSVPDVFKQEKPEFMEKLRKSMEKIDKIKTSRSELTAEIGEVMAKLENLGLSKKGCKAAMSYLDLNDKDRENFDLTVEIMRKAAGEPVQYRLFEASIQSEIKDRSAEAA